jgi:hypothetical protein
MSRVSVSGGRTSSRPPSKVWKFRNGRRCDGCRRYGIYAPNQLICCGCLGWLPLIFTVGGVR